MINNLTEGKPLKLLFFFAVPMVVGNLFQQLYNMVDSMVVGRFVGEDALAAVGSSFPVVFLSVAVAAGLSMGCTVVISQFFGAGKIREMKVTVSTALISLGVIGLIIMGIGELTSFPLLKLLGTDPDIMTDSLAYLRIYFGGAVFLFLYNSLNGIYNALGDSQTPLKFLMVSALTNIVLDLLFVIKFNMGVAGVAWATLISQGMCAVFSFFVLIARLRKMENEEEARGKAFTFFDMSSAERIAKVGVPSMLQQSIVSVGMLLVQSVVNRFGSAALAGYSAASRIESVCVVPMIATGNAVATFTAQNIGAGQTDRVRQGYRASYGILAVFAAVIAVVLTVFNRSVIAAFLGGEPSPEAMETGTGYLSYIAFFLILLGAKASSDGVLRGCGDMLVFTLANLINLAIRVTAAFALAPVIGVSAVWCVVPLGWLVNFLISFLRY